MKKLIPLLILLGGGATGFSQGTITFQNSVVFQTVDPSGGNRLVYNPGPSAVTGNGIGLAGTQWVAELYAGTSAGSLAPVTASTSRFRGSTTASKGKWALTAIAGANDFVVTPIDFGQTGTFQVKVWDLSAFNTYEAAVAAGGTTGASLVFTMKVPVAGDTFIPDFYMENLQAFALVVPEPSAVALSVLGVAGLLLIRRRK